MAENLHKEFAEFLRFMAKYRIEGFSNDELVSYFQQASYFRVRFAEDFPEGFNIAGKYVRQLLKEMIQRNVRPQAISYAFDDKGKLVYGAEEIRAVFEVNNFDYRITLLDELLALCKNDSQRKSLIDLAYEVTLNEMK